MSRRLSQNLTIGRDRNTNTLIFGEAVRGKCASRIRASTNVIVLDPQVANVFPNDKAVNDALRGLIKLARSSTRPTNNK